MPMLKKREDLTDLHDDNTDFALGLSDNFAGFVLIKEENEENIETKKEEVKKMDIDEETKYKVINEYNNIKKAKSFKEKAKYEKRIRELLKK